MPKAEDQKKEELGKKYEILLERAEYARNEVEGKIKNIIRDLQKTHDGHTVVHHYHARIKSLESCIKKMESRGYEGLHEITDFLGYRLVCLYQKDISDVCAAIDREFAVDSDKDYINDPKPPEKGGYTGAVHKKIKVQVTCGGLKVSVPMEIQVTDVIMSAVWETEHDDNYKSDKKTDVNAQDDNQILIGCVNTIHTIVAKRCGEISTEKYNKELSKHINSLTKILGKRAPST